MNKELAIQFVNYKTGEYLRRAIETVRKDLAESAIRYSFYILNNSPEEQLSWISENDTIVLNTEKNLGFGTGHNRLLELHNAEFTLILNPDIEIIESQTVFRMIQSFREKLSIGCLGVKLLDESRQQQMWDHGELDHSQGHDSPMSTYEERSTIGEVAWVSGADLLLKTDAVKSIGGFDENFFLYKEEEDLCLRLRQSGLKTYYDPTISLLHYGSVVASKDSNYFDKSISYFNKKYDL